MFTKREDFSTDQLWQLIDNTFKYQYERKVDQGVLFTIFSDDDVKRVIKDIEGVEYLYSERCE